MRPLHWQIKTIWSATSDDFVKPVLLDDCKESIGWWLQEERWSLVISLKVPSPSLLLYSNTLVTG